MKISTKNNLTDGQITTAVQKHFNGAKITNIQKINEGTLNTIYLIEGTQALSGGVILKTAPIEMKDIPTVEKGGLYTEIYIHQLLDGLDIPVPKMYAYDFSKTDIPCDYMLLERVKGKSWSNHLHNFILMKKSKPKIMEQLGSISATIHGVDGDWFGYIKGEIFHRYDTWGGAFTAMVNDLLEEAERCGYRLPYADIRKAVTARRELLDEIKTPNLVNFDMWYGNIFLVKENKRLEISGIIDFERYFFGDPFCSFPSLAFINIEKEKEFIAGYSEVIGTPFALNDKDRERLILYSIYADLLEIVGTYRFSGIVGAVYRFDLWIEIKFLLKKLSKLSQSIKK